MVIKVGDKIRHLDVPDGVWEVEVLEIQPCDSSPDPGHHPMYRVLDPVTGRPDWVCSEEFVRV